MTRDSDANRIASFSPLLTIRPRELAGRDTVRRFQAQFRGAALACLRILEGSAVDRVYCDYHDDFVVREIAGGKAVYEFFQVKTKGEKKHQWSRTELFGLPIKLPPKNPEYLGPAGSEPAPANAAQLAKFKGSFVGKLLEHTVNFGDACVGTTFLTNAYLGDEVEEIMAAVAKGDVGNRTVRYLSDNFAAAYAIDPAPHMRRVHASIRKLKMSAGHDHLDPNHSDFDSKAVKALYTYSEINLTHVEGVELTKNLLSLVQAKSSSKLIADLTQGDLDNAAGIGVDDLLELLPISRGAYVNFLKNGDTKALKNATVLQRKLSEAGASPELIEVASKWKIHWDNWFRLHRHTYEQEIVFLQYRLNAIYARWQKGEVSFGGLQVEVSALKDELSGGALNSLLSVETLTGGVLSELVRSESR
ncbi:dsDNA nuclease domain-containing protein [Dyella sp. 20L07]|uniref:dsDNA nuclease domain-containing protein n=1 Tax=Dyella sp. 20L07 TaxID=3384240 RepID=UPI003D2E9884